MQSIDNALEKLSKSKFRSSFHLKAKDIAYIDEKGMDTVRRHAEDFIEKSLHRHILKTTVSKPQ